MRSTNSYFLLEDTNRETDSIMNNNIWVLCDLPEVVKCRVASEFLKRNITWCINWNNKVRFVVVGYWQERGINFIITHSRITKDATIRVSIALASIHNLVLNQMNVKIVFLMVIWMKRYIWNNETDVLFLDMQTRYVTSWDHYKILNKRP